MFECAAAGGAVGVRWAVAGSFQGAVDEEGERTQDGNLRGVMGLSCGRHRNVSAIGVRQERGASG